MSAIAALAAMSLAGCQSAPREPVPAVQPLPTASVKAREAERRGEWATAARHWQAELAATPDNVETMLALARTLRLSNACGRAAPYLERLRSARPEGLDVLLETAKCHLMSGRFEAAATVLETAVRTHPQSWEAETVLAATLDHMERSEEALKHHNRAVELAPNSAIALSNKGLSLALGGDLDGALDLMRQATALPGAPSRVRMNLALLQAVAGNGDVAAMMARQETQGGDENLKLLQRIAAAARKRN